MESADKIQRSNAEQPASETTWLGEKIGEVLHR